MRMKRSARPDARGGAATSERISKSFSVGSKEVETRKNQVAGERQPGESKNYASNQNNSRTRSQPEKQPAREARGRKTNRSKGQQTCSAGEGSRRTAGAGAVQAM